MALFDFLDDIFGGRSDGGVSGSSGSTNYAKLKFPLDDDRDYKGKIVFKSVQLEGVDTALTGFFTGLFDKNTLSRTDDNTGYDNSEQTAEQEETRLKQLNEAKAELAGLQKDRQPVKGNKKQKNYGGQVTLYLPSAISITDAVSYTNFDLGILGATADAAMRGGVNAGGALATAAVSGMQSFYDAITGSTPEGLAGKYAGFAAMRAAQQLPDTGFSEFKGAVRGVTRTAVNPNTRPLFQSVPLREFSFPFRMIATSKKEAEEIKKIVKFFRMEMYPEEIKGIGGLEDVSLGYKYPNPFQIRTYYDDKELEIRFQDSYLRSVTVNYNQNGAAFHKDGNFVEVEITLSFIEQRAMSKDILKEQYSRKS